jgi:hypothetical protein
MVKEETILGKIGVMLIETNKALDSLGNNDYNAVIGHLKVVNQQGWNLEWRHPKLSDLPEIDVVVEIKHGISGARVAAQRGMLLAKLINRLPDKEGKSPAELIAIESKERNHHKGIQKNIEIIKAMVGLALRISKPKPWTDPRVLSLPGNKKIFLEFLQGKGYYSDMPEEEWIKIIEQSPLAETYIEESKKAGRKLSRRDFFKYVVAGAAAGTIAQLGLGYLGDKLLAALDSIEKYVREVVLDLRALSGEIETKLAEETAELKQFYASGILQEFVDLGLATPDDLKEFELIIKNAEEFEKHYDLPERIKIFKDRIDLRLMNFDQWIDSVKPDVLLEFDEKLRKYADDTSDLFGLGLSKKSGKAGKQFRAGFKRKLELLCQIYGFNENNRIAQGKVLEEINRLLKNWNLRPEEKSLLLYLKKEFEKEGGKERLIEFIRKYKENGPDVRVEVLLGLKAKLSEAEEIFTKVRDFKGEALKLQGLLQEGISLKEELRRRKSEDIDKYQKVYSKKITIIKTKVDAIIQKLKDMGLDIETREDYINKSTLTKNVSKVLKPAINIASALTGFFVGVAWWRRDRLKRKMRKQVLAEIKKGRKE